MLACIQRNYRYLYVLKCYTCNLYITCIRNHHVHKTIGRLVKTQNALDERTPPLKSIEAVSNVTARLTVPLTETASRGSHSKFVTLSNFVLSFSRLMSKYKMPSVNLLPPASVRGMKVLDRDAFQKTVQIPSIVISTKSINSLSRLLKKKMLHITGVKAIADISGDSPQSTNSKLLLLDPEKCETIDSFSEHEVALLNKHNVDLTELKWFDLKLNYANWNHSEILAAILPETSNSVTSFSSIGHILHLNLKEEVIDYKYIIGEVILDKISYAKTVVNKTNSIDNTYRNFTMEVLAGEPNFLTMTKENGINFEFDFSQVYWNPRLGKEHERIVTTVNHGDIVYDIFAGVGPFSLPALRRGATVIANDLNPSSYKWLCHSATLNRLHLDRLTTHCMDGRAFIRDVIRPDLLRRGRDGRKVVLMNLPAMAIEFLDAFHGLLSGETHRTMEMTVHCYCFSKSEDCYADINERLCAVLGSAPKHDVRIVRNVAPNKLMLCITFQLDDCILFSDELLQPKITATESSEPPEKKLKL